MILNLIEIYQYPRIHKSQEKKDTNRIKKWIPFPSALGIQILIIKLLIFYSV